MKESIELISVCLLLIIAVRLINKKEKKVIVRLRVENPEISQTYLPAGHISQLIILQNHIRFFVTQIH